MHKIQKECLELHYGPSLEGFEEHCLLKNWNNYRNDKLEKYQG